MARTTDRKNKRRKTAVAYGRFSSNNQREESIDAQMRAIREYCKREDIELIAEFKDEAISGKTDDRADFQKMINRLLKNNLDVDYVLVHKFNRFARNKYDSALYKKKLKDAGIKVVSVTQKIDETPEGELLEGFLETIDQYYSANLAVEVRKGLRENALKGKHAGGQVLFGLSLDNEGYYIPNQNAKIVRRIFEEYAAGYPKTEICERLNQEGYRNQRGKPFNTRTLYDLLRNEKYIGNYVYTIEQTETIRLDGIIKDPIVDYQLWETVQQLCNESSIRGRYRTQKRSYYLTGRAFCEHCGSPISGAGSKRSRNGTLNYYYKCVGKTKHKNGCKNPSLNKDWFEPKVLKSVVNAVMTDEQIANIAKLTFEKLQEMRDIPIVTTQSLQKELSGIISKQDKLTDLYLEGDLSKDMLDKKNSALKSRKFEIERELQKRKIVDNSEEVTEESIADFIKEYISYLEKDNTIDGDFMRAVFGQFVDKVVIGKEVITVDVIVDFSRMYGGDNKRNGGANHLLPPAKLKRRFKRKKHIHGKNK